MHNCDGHPDHDPQPHGDQVTPAQDGTQLKRDVVGQDVLDGVGVVRHDAHGSRPFVVLFMVPAVKRTPVNKSGKKPKILIELKVCR